MRADRLHQAQSFWHMHAYASHAAALFGRVRLSVLYAAIGVAVALAWLLSTFVLSAKTPLRVTTNASPQSQEQLQSQSQTESQAEEAAPTTPLSPLNRSESSQTAGGQSTMNTNVTTENVTSNSSTVVHSDTNGTTVTVNGNTQTVAPGQSFQQTYTSEDGSSTTKINISNHSHSGQPGSAQ